jgi:hypothetical protein
MSLWLTIPLGVGIVGVLIAVIPRRIRRHDAAYRSLRDAMLIWFAIPLGVGLIAAFIAVARHGSARGIYVGIVERRLARGTDRDRLQVRVYVDETVARELPAPSKLTGRMFIRETNSIVPLMFDRVPPPFIAPDSERSREWQEGIAGSIVPIIFRFDPASRLAVHAGLLVDVYIGEP